MRTSGVIVDILCSSCCSSSSGGCCHSHGHLLLEALLEGQVLSVVLGVEPMAQAAQLKVKRAALLLRHCCCSHFAINESGTHRCMATMCACHFSRLHVSCPCFSHACMHAGVRGTHVTEAHRQVGGLPHLAAVDSARTAPWTSSGSQAGGPPAAPCTCQAPRPSAGCGSDPRTT